MRERGTPWEGERDSMRKREELHERERGLHGREGNSMREREGLHEKERGTP